MDGAQKQDAIIAEVTRGTTPATPTFLLVPSTSIGGSPDRPEMRSPSRQAHRSAVTTYAGLNSYPKSIDAVLAYEASLHLLFASLFQGAWATDVLKFVSALAAFTLEEKYEAGATDNYRRSTGAFCDSLQMSASLGSPIRLAFGIKALGESTATAAIAGSTYTAIAGGKPFTPANVVVNDAFGLSGAKLQALDIGFKNNSVDLYGFGSNDPDASSLGIVEIDGTLRLRFTALTQYSGFVAGDDQALDLTLGHTTAEKYQLQLPNCRVFAPDISDPGPTGPHILSLRFMAKYSAGDATAAILTRAVA